ncbi:MAG: adenylate kinase family protein [Methanoregulaceae archaeon]
MMCGITGTPGTGKTAVAEELVRRGYPVIRVNDTVDGYILEKDPGRDTLVIDVDRWADEFQPVEGFLEGHIAHLIPCTKTVILRCRPDILRERLSRRDYSREKIDENCEAEALDVILVETLEEQDPASVLEIDTTSLTSREVADRIEGFYLGKIPSAYGDIDWSSYLEAAG